MPFFNASLTKLDEQETRRYAGLRNSSFSDKMITEACTEAQILSQPKAVWQVYDYDAAAHQLKTADTAILLEGKSIIRHLQASLKVICLCVTIGEAIENTISQHFKEGAYSHSLLLDAAATTAVEAAADALETAIRPEFAKQGLKLIQRFSPGYGDFDIHFQPELLKLSMAKDIGVQLTESYMLSPRKSITALIGLIPAGQNICPTINHNCQACTQANCLSRKEPFNDKNI